MKLGLPSSQLLDRSQHELVLVLGCFGHLSPKKPCSMVGCTRPSEVGVTGKLHDALHWELRMIFWISAAVLGFLPIFHRFVNVYQRVWSTFFLGEAWQIQKNYFNPFWIPSPDVFPWRLALAITPSANGIMWRRKIWAKHLMAVCNGDLSENRLYIYPHQMGTSNQTHPLCMLIINCPINCLKMGYIHKIS